MTLSKLQPSEFLKSERHAVQFSLESKKAQQILVNTIETQEGFDAIRCTHSDGTGSCDWPRDATGIRLRPVSMYHCFNGFAATPIQCAILSGANNDNICMAGFQAEGASKTRACKMKMHAQRHEKLEGMTLFSTSAMLCMEWLRCWRLK